MRNRTVFNPRSSVRLRSQVDPSAKPPVCRLQDYNRLRYEKKQQKQKKKAKDKRTEQTKEIRVRHTITEHDLNTKVCVCVCPH